MEVYLPLELRYVVYFFYLVPLPYHYYLHVPNRSKKNHKKHAMTLLFLPAAKRHGLVEVFVVVLLGKTFFWVNFVVVLLGKTIFCFYDNFLCFLLERLFLYIVCILKDANCKPGLKSFFNNRMGGRS